MLDRDMAYLYSVTAGLIVLYYFLRSFYPYLFKEVKILGKRRDSYVSPLIITGVSLITYALSLNINDIETQNRIIHMIGGGFIGMLVSYLAVNDSRLALDKTRFILVSALTITALGVFNEIIEFFLQNYFDFIAAPNINDSWFDLISNTLGIVLGAACFTPFLRKK